jgi:hypothetical protein
MLIIAIFVITTVAAITTISGTEPWLPAWVYNAHAEARTSPRGTLLYERFDAL